MSAAETTFNSKRESKNQYSHGRSGRTYGYGPATTVPGLSPTYEVEPGSDLRKSSGRQRQQFLDQPYNLFVLENELESFEKITNERDIAILRAEGWRQNA